MEFNRQANKPRAELLFSPMVSLTIGLTLAVFVASLAIVLALRIPCAATSRRRQKELSNDHESRDASPGPSDHSVNKDIDENDERNPDVVPELVDYDDQVEYTRKRQHISTIDTSCNPCRNVLINSATGQHMDITEETLCGAHSIGYCTLRSGRNAQNIRPVGTLPMNVTPHVYSNVIAQCTLPRQSFQNEWPRYTSNAIEPNRVTPNVSTFHQLPISAEKSNTHVSRESPEEYAGSSSSTSNSSMISASNTYAQSHGRTIALHHMNQSQTSRACMGAPSNIINTIEPTQSDDEATVQTPLMIKRDSSV